MKLGVSLAMGLRPCNILAHARKMSQLAAFGFDSPLTEYFYFNPFYVEWRVPCVIKTTGRRACVQAHSNTSFSSLLVLYCEACDMLLGRAYYLFFELVSPLGYQEPSRPQGGPRNYIGLGLPPTFHTFRNNAHLCESGARDGCVSIIGLGVGLGRARFCNDRWICCDTQACFNAVLFSFLFFCQDNRAQVDHCITWHA